MRACFATAVALTMLSVSHSAFAISRIEQSLLKLQPEEWAQQACVIKGLDVVKRYKHLRRADRLMPDVFNRAKFAKGVVTAKGAAVRVGKRWYELSFECSVTDDRLTATTFTFELGEEIPPEVWDEVGLWR